MTPTATEPGTSTPTATRYVRAQDGELVGPEGRRWQPRGVGLGNWLLPEGYMWGFGDAAASPRQIEALVADLLGADEAAAFWRGFREAYVTRADVAAIAYAGFDHVRLPINWRVLMDADGSLREDGFALIDRLVGWCADAGLLVLLDLHGAPGGQTGTNIDDSAGRPELFMDPRNEDLTVALWTAIAARYRDEPTVLGYDLLNEPLPHEWQHRYPAELVALYRRLTAAIRAVDPHHLIMYEGTHWATSWDIFTEVWDDNSALQFHKYWSAPDRASIEHFLEVGRRLGLPVYMGEGGENHPEWLAVVHQLYDDCGIGWNFWPWKKLETATSPLSVVAPEGWDEVLAYAAGRGPRPGPDAARRTFAELLVNVRAEKCLPRDDVVAALFRRAPVSLPAHAFGFRDGMVEALNAPGRRVTGLREDDGVVLTRRDGTPVVDFTYDPMRGPEADVMAHLEPGEHVTYEVTVRPGRWRVVLDAATQDGSAPAVRLRGDPTGLRAAQGPRDGDESAWSASYVARVEHALRITVGAGPVPLAIARVHVEAEDEQ